MLGRNPASEETSTPSQSPAQIRAMAIATAERIYGVRLTSFGETSRMMTDRRNRRVERPFEQFFETTRSGTYTRRSFARYRDDPGLLVALFDPNPETGDAVEDLGTVRRRPPGRPYDGPETPAPEPFVKVARVDW